MDDISALVGANSNQGPYRSGNEDAYWVSTAQTPIQYGALYIVADGVGGQEHGAAAAQLAVQVIQDVFYQARRSGRMISDALEDAILQANQAVYDQAQARSSKMGCTVVATVQHKNQLYVAHVGDARVYLLLENRLRQLTRDDTWVQRQLDAEIITAEEAKNHEWRNVVTQVLGNKLEITVHQSEPQPLQPGNIFLLCSDGLHGVLSSETMYRLMKSNPPQAAADRLVQAAIEANTKDNVTAVVVHAAPTIPKAIPPPAAPQQKQTAGLHPPLWVTVTVITAIILLIGITLFRAWPSGDTPSNQNEGLDSEAAPLLVDTAVPPSPAPTLPQPAIIATEPIPQPTEPPQIVLPTLPANTATPEPTLTATPPPLAYVSTEGQLFVWQDSQIQANTCGQFAQEGFVLQDGDQVRILNNNAISIAGPDETCLINDFIKIQSVDNPEVEGWVLANSLCLPRPEENCLP
jgi:PPM family protein phosphatase